MRRAAPLPLWNLPDAAPLRKEIKSVFEGNDLARELHEEGLDIPYVPVTDPSESRPPPRGVAVAAGLASTLNLSESRMPAYELEALTPVLASVRFVAGETLFTAGDRECCVYLLQSGAVALHVPQADGTAFGVQLACRGDVVGLDALFINEPAPPNAVALIAGEARRASISTLMQICRAQGEVSLALATVLARQNRALQVELACARHHGVEERLARLLHELSARLKSSEVPLTQEQLALVLGVQRTTITEQAGRLKSLGAISYARGVVRITDPAKLAAATCGCFS